MDIDEEFSPDEEKLWQAFHKIPMPQDTPLLFDRAPWTKKIRRPARHWVKPFFVLAVFIVGSGGWYVFRTISRQLSVSYLVPANLSEIRMNTVTTGWAIGHNSQSIYHTTSGGQYWSKVLALPSNNPPPYAMAFPTGNDAELVEYNVEGQTVSVYQTSDQGKRWHTTLLPIRPTALNGATIITTVGRQYVGLDISRAQSLTVALFYRSNRSTSWHPLNFEPSLANVAALSPGPQGSLWMVAQASSGKDFSLLESRDAGQRWLPVNLPPLPVKNSLSLPLPPEFFGNIGILPVVLSIAHVPPVFPSSQVWIYRTQDGGKHWFPWTHYQSMLGDIEAVSPNHIWATATSAPGSLGTQPAADPFSILTLRHGHWTSLPLPSGITHSRPSDQLLEVDFVDADTGWMIVNKNNGDARLWVTHNGGKSWHALHPALDNS